MSALAASVAAPRRASCLCRRTRAHVIEPARASAETRAAGGSTTEKKGKVFLIGAGPGGIDHVTVRALRLLRACDVVVHDDLGASDAALLDEAPPSAERVHVGKRGGDARFDGLTTPATRCRCDLSRLGDAAGVRIGRLPADARIVTPAQWLWRRCHRCCW